jgi:hypothetical protein
MYGEGGGEGQSRVFNGPDIFDDFQFPRYLSNFLNYKSPIDFSLGFIKV